MKSDANVKRYVDQHRRFSSNGASQDPPWLGLVRDGGLKRFTDIGFPTTRNEDWRFTSVKSIVGTKFEIAKPTTVDEETVTDFAYAADAAARVVLVNGSRASENSFVGKLPAGVIVSSLQEAIDKHPELVEARLGKAVSGEDNGFASLNTAFVRGGVFVYVPPNVVVSGLVEILSLIKPTDTPVVAYTRNLIIVERGAQLRLVETYAGVGATPYCANTVTEIFVGDGATVDCYRVQRETADGFHVASTGSVQGRDSTYSMHAVPLGARLSRHDVRMVMDGEGGQGTLNGLYLMGGNQHVDHNTIIDHAKPHCESHEYFNGILDGSARAVFNGRIIVRPGAQKTNSKQTNNNLLLSGDARADSQPQLEIYADDVRCTHGATLGPLDENSLFYLQARGIDAESARRMMTMGFGLEVLERMGDAAVREKLEMLVRDGLQSGTVKPV